MILVRTIFSVILSVCVLSGIAQYKVPVKPAPAWTTLTSYNNEIKDTTNISNGSYYLLYDEQYNSITRETYRHTAQKVLTEKGLENISTLSHSFDPKYETITFHSIDIIRNGNKINQLLLGTFQVLNRETSMERLVYDGNLTAVFNLMDVQIGDVLDYSYSLKGSNPLTKDKFSRVFYFNYSVPVGRVSIRALIKSGSNFEIRKINSPPEPSIVKQKDITIYQWDANDIPALLTEDSSPGWHDPYDHVQISSFGSWKDLGAWAADIYRMNEIPKGLLAQIPNINKSNKEESIRKVIQFVQDEVRYLSFSEGIHGYKPHAPAKILAQRFGDCKDKSVLLASLLTELNVESYPVLVSTEYGRTLDNYLPSPGLFNHCIVQFTLNDSIHWIDPTISLQRGKLNNIYFPDYSNGLVISSKTKQLTPINFEPRSSISVEEHFTSDKIGGDVNLFVKTVYRDQEADNYRSYLKSSGIDEIEKINLNFYANDYLDITTGKRFRWTDNEKENIIISEENYVIGSFWTYDSAVSKYTSSVYPRVVANYLSKPRTKIRQNPYLLNHPVSISQKVVVRMPEPWTIAESSRKIENAGFEFTSTDSYKDSTINLLFTYRTKKSYLGKDEIRQYVNQIDEINNKLTYTFTYTPNKNETSNSNFNLLFMAFVLFVGLYFMLLKGYNWDPEPKESVEKYTVIGGWLILPAIGFCITPILLINDLVISDNYFDEEMLQILRNPFNELGLGLGLFVFFEAVLNIIFVTYSIFMVVMFFARRSSVPTLVIIFHSINVLLQVGDAALGSVFGVEMDNGEVKTAIRSVIGAAIWIPYFLISDRSRGTFVKRRF